VTPLIDLTHPLVEPADEFAAHTFQVVNSMMLDVLSP
jgi:hypothetical protein